MSYSVLIVDDDKRVRTGLIKNINWNQLGFETPLQADSTAAALSVFSANHIDVLITDIRMPVSSGLELCRKVSGLYPKTAIIVLSGYSDFEYAKQAIQYGVKHYLTKPTDLMEIRNVLTEIKELLDKEIKAETRVKELEERFTQSIGVLIEQFCIDISFGTMRNDNSFKKFLEKNNIVFSHTFYSVSSVKTVTKTDTNNDKDVHIIDLLKNFISLHLKNYNLIFHMYHLNENSIHILFNYDDQKFLNGAIEELYRNFNNMLKIDTIIAVSGSVTNLEQVSECYNQVHKLSVSNNKPGIYKYTFENSDNIEAFDHDSTYVKEAEKQLLSYICSCEEEKASELIDVLFSRFDQFESSQELFLHLMFAIVHHISFLNLNLRDLMGNQFLMTKKAQEISDISEIKAALRKCIHHVIDAIKESQTSFSYKMAERIKQYIENNYGGNISLYTASENVNLSPSYISRIFKKCLGYNFVDYLTEVRIRKAKELLADMDIKIYQVADMVGYRSTKHFSQVFKANVGMTPLSYKKSVQ